MQRIITLGDFEREARRRLPNFLFDMIAGGVADEHLVEANRQAFMQAKLLPFACTGVEATRQAIKLFDVEYDAPFGVGPAGAAELFRPGGADVMIARAAAAARVPYVLSGASMASVEEVAAASTLPIWFQLYPARDRSISQDFLSRAEAAGVKTLVITVDTPVQPKRERSIRSGVTLPLKLQPAVLGRLLLEGIAHPRWAVQFVCAGGTPKMMTWAPYVHAGATAGEVGKFFRSQSPSPQTWEDVAQWRRRWKGSLVIKGIMRPSDAREALALGADGLIVSNHGGKVLDHYPSSLSLLPAVLEAVKGAIPVLLDGGIRTGSDIVIAKAAGAAAVLLGRSPLYAVTVGGEDGVSRMIEILREELHLAMASVGIADIAAVGGNLLAPAPATTC